jgi:hypothetical protein
MGAGVLGGRSSKIRCRNRSPQVMGQVTDQQLIDQVDGPENVMDQQQDPAVIIMPTDQERVDAEDAINDACIPVVHAGRLKGEGKLF